jgi:hypothetical protein
VKFTPPAIACWAFLYAASMLLAKSLVFAAYPLIQAFGTRISVEKLGSPAATQLMAAMAGSDDQIAFVFWHISWELPCSR